MKFLTTLIKLSLGFLLTAFVLGSIGLVSLYLYLEPKLPSPEELPQAGRTSTAVHARANRQYRGLNRELIAARDC